MNTRYLLVLIPIVAAGFFYLLQPGQQQAHGGVATANGVHYEAGTTDAGTFDADEAEREKRRQVRAELAKVVSVELMREMDEADFEIREPRYRELFARWKISDAAANRVLDIIKERERQKSASFVTYAKAEGRPGSVKDMVVTDNVEDALAEQELARLLGVNRHRELAGLEERLDTERAVRAKFQED